MTGARFQTVQGIAFAYRTRRGDSFMARGIAEALAVMRQRGADRLERFFGPQDWREVYHERGQSLLSPG